MATRTAPPIADFRELLARRDLDAVLIATGDRWHTPLSILAAKSGKDIYSEKPVSLTIGEGRAMVDTMTRYGTVYQAGHQRRSVGSYRFQVETARSGMIGKVHTVICQVWEGPTVALDKPRPVPAGFDYDMWLGPTPWHPYTNAYVNGWNYFWDTGAGPIIGMGCHYTDIAQWGLQRDDTGPVAYEGTATWKRRRLQRDARDRRLLLHLRRRREDRPPLQRRLPGPLHPLCRLRGLDPGGRSDQRGDGRARVDPARPGTSPPPRLGADRRPRAQLARLHQVPQADHLPPRKRPPRHHASATRSTSVSAWAAR